MAMYTQLSDELDSTNSGVVALYAELDDRTRQLQAATESKARLLNSVSHELRSPVTSVLGLARLMADTTPGTPESERQLQLITRSASDLLDLVNQLLDLAKVEYGRLQVDVLPIDLVPLVDEVVSALRPTAADGVAVTVEGASAPVQVESDQRLVRQILRNLVSNALAFTRAGSVRVVLADDAEWASVEVVDTGIGIAPGDLPRVFEEFFQVRNPLQSSRPGTGLGLPYALHVAEALGGSLTAVSEPGSGSTFTLRLPRRGPAACEPSASPS
jgi:signal transduction histidine kinase